VSRVYEPLFALWLCFLGLAVGSFLNVVIARVPRGESIVRPRSKCPRCGAALSWYDNVPVFSWVWLRARCRSCRAPISWRYPMVEVLTLGLFVAAWWRFDWTWELARALVLITLLVPLTFIDLEHWLLPFVLTLPGIALGLLSSLPLGWEGVWPALAGASLGFSSFWAMEWLGQKIFRKEALGGGDKFLLALIGAFETHRSLLVVIFLASLQGAVVGLLLLALRGRAGPAPAAPTEPGAASDDDWVPGPTNIPFGPWLALAAMEFMFLAPTLGRALPAPLGSLWGVP